MKKDKNKFTPDFGSAARSVDPSYEPTELENPVPWPLIAIAMALAILGGVMLYFEGQATESGKEAQQTRSAAEEGKAPADGTVAELQEAKDKHAAAHAAALYGTYCATCHQTNGAGVRGAIPPLDGSRYVVADVEVPVAILLRGISGLINVKGNAYIGQMPSFHASLKDEEIALVLTHIRSAWSNNVGGVAPEQVATVRHTLESDLGYPWASGYELQEAFGIDASSIKDVHKVETTAPAQDEDDQEDTQ